MQEIKCSFCGQPTTDYETGIKDMDSIVCHRCISILKEIMDEKLAVNTNNDTKILKPHEIKKLLDEYVIGQDTAKKKVAVEVYNHYKRINTKPSKNVDIPKNNILLIGASGSGKTYMLEILAKILDVPIVFGDASTFTVTGYQGKDIDVLLKALIDKSDGDIEKAEKGIVFIDEIDKIARSTDISDCTTTGVQQNLLAIMGGCDYQFDKKNQLDNTPDSINTRNILFICGGAFEGLTDIISKRLNVNNQIGFASSITNIDINKENMLDKLTTDDLIKYGLTREFIGRLSLIAILNKLTKTDLKNILTKPKNSIIKQYQALLKLDGVKLTFNKEAIDYIADVAFKNDTGARGLKNVISDKMNDLMFEIPKDDSIKEYVVTREFLEK